VSESWLWLREVGRIAFTLFAWVLFGCLRAPATADGLTPRLIVSGTETLVASAVATESPFNADRTGTLDATGGIQRALDAVGSAGGGAVFLPGGRYRIEGGLKLPYSTTLAGEAEPLRRGRLSESTVLLAMGAGGSEDGPPLIDGGIAESGLLDLAIYYPQQTPEDIRPYPFTVSGKMMQIRNVVLCNSYNGVELHASNASVVENVRGTVLRRGLALPHSTEFSWAHDVQFSADFWRAAAEKLGLGPEGDWDAVARFCRENLVGFELGRLDAFAMQSCGVSEAAVGFRVQKRPEENEHPVFGFGGIVAGLRGEREEHGWDPWYYGMHYADLDRVPEAGGKKYSFARLPMPARTGPDAFLNVTLPPYSAAGDGQADDTEALENAVAAAGEKGGGVVYLPPGEYKVTRPLVVPTGVELRGPLGVGKAREYRETCSLAVYCGADASDPETAQALVTLTSHSGIRGLSIVYPEQPYDVSRLTLYPYSIRGRGEGVWIADVVLINSIYGIDLARYRCDEHVVRGVWGTALHRGISIGGGSQDGKLERVTFSYGPWAEAGRFAKARTKAAKEALAKYCGANAVYYSFGDCVGETAWGLAGFLPWVQCEFTDVGAGCRDAELWLTMHDVGRGTNLQFDGGESIHLIGYFGTGEYEKARNWFEVGESFRGPVHVYAPTLQPRAWNHPLRCTPETVRIHREISLTSGRPATATESCPGSEPASAVDRSPWTAWEAPVGSALEVDLGEMCRIDRFGIVSGLTVGRDFRVAEAELLGSVDGKQFRRAARLKTWGGAWADAPVEPVEARYVRLNVVQGGANGLVQIAEFDVFGYPSGPAQP